MKIAVITDVHSNYHGLSAVLNDIKNEKPDFIIGAGDMVGCSAYIGSIEVWNALHDIDIPFVMGNEEERIVRFHNPKSDPYLKEAVQFKPLQFRAKQFSANYIKEMRALPMQLRLEGPQNQDVLICHASPCDLHRSPMLGIDSQLEEELHSVNAQVIVVGHHHKKWHQYWQGKLLIMAGSAGLPLRGKIDKVDYLILTYHMHKWQFEYKSVIYNSRAAIQEIVESEFLIKSRPIGWLMFDEVLTQEDHLIPFFHEYCPKDKPEDLENWTKLVIGYLDYIKRWEVVKPYVHHLL